MSILTRRELFHRKYSNLLRRSIEGLDESSFPTTVQVSLASQAIFARYDPSGRFIAAGGYSGQVHIWDLTTKAIIRTLNGHKKVITGIESV